MRPHGQCLSELVQRQPCLLDPCYTYTNMVDKEERAAICVRSDGLIVEGKLLQSSTCPIPSFRKHILLLLQLWQGIFKKKKCWCAQQKEKGFYDAILAALASSAEYYGGEKAGILLANKLRPSLFA